MCFRKQLELHLSCLELGTLECNSATFKRVSVTHFLLKDLIFTRINAQNRENNLRIFLGSKSKWFKNIESQQKLGTLMKKTV